MWAQRHNYLSNLYKHPSVPFRPTHFIPLKHTHLPVPFRHTWVPPFYPTQTHPSLLLKDTPICSSERRIQPFLSDTPMYPSQSHTHLPHLKPHPSVQIKDSPICPFQTNPCVPVKDPPVCLTQLH